MYKKYCLLGLLFCLLPYLNAQEVFSKTYDFSKDSDFGTSILKWNDDYVMYVAGVCDQNSIFCNNLIKVDGNGNVLWKQTINKHRYFSDIGPSLLVLKGDNLLTGYTPEDEQGKQYIELRLIGIDGDSLWGAKIQRAENLILTSLMVTDKGNIIGAGDWYDKSVRRSTYLYLFKMDMEGNMIWEHKINPKQFNVIAPTDLIGLPNEEFLMTSFYCEKTWRCGEFGDQVYHMNADGSIKWERSFNVEEDFAFPKVVVLDNKNIAVAYKWGYEWKGNTAPPPCIQGLSPQGDSLWDYCFITKIGYDIWDIYKAKNGDILGCGSKFTRTTQQGWLFRLSEEGNLLWERNILYDINPYIKDIHEGEIYSIIDNDDGFIYATGYVVDTFENHIPTLDAANTWLLKLTPEGCLLPGCTEDIQYVSDYLTATEKPVKAEVKIRVYPNPSADIFNVEVPSMYKIASLRVYNMNGEIIDQNNNMDGSDPQINLSNHPKGSYLVKVIFDNGEHYVTKLLKHG